MKKSFNITKQPKSLIAASFILLLGLFFIRALRMPYPVESETSADMPLGLLLDGIFSGNVLFSLIAFSVVTAITAVTIARVIDKFSLSNTPTFLPVIMYLIMSGGLFIPTGSLSAPLCSLLLTLSAWQMVESFRRTHTFSNVFKSALCLGTIPLLYSPAALVAVMLPVTLIIYVRSWRETVTGFVGLALPFVIASTLSWISGDHWLATWTALSEGITVQSSPTFLDAIMQAGIPGLCFAGFLTALTLYSILIISFNARRMRTRARKIYIHFIILLLVVFSTCLLPSATIITLALAAVPASLISTVFFIRHKRKLGLAIYLVLVFSAVVINILPFIGIF